MTADDTGVLLSPATQRVKTRASGRPRTFLRRLGRVLVLALALAAAGGGAVVTEHVLAPGSALVDPMTAADAKVTAARHAQIDAEGRARAAEDDLASAQQKISAAKSKDQGQIAAAQAQTAALEKQLSSVAGKDSEVSKEGDAIHLKLVDKVLFKLGDADLTPGGEKLLTKVGAALATIDQDIWVQGHTDDTPITPAEGVTPKFASNWELSAARALTVVHYLEDVVGIDPKRLAAVAFGEHHPVSKVKAKNRRIEIVLYPPTVMGR
jgi:chemotaxis protein MotB